MKKILKNIKNILLQPSYRNEYWALQRLKKFPRYTRTSVSLSNLEIQLVDAASFLFQYKEIFQKQIYKFSAQTPTPRILDCGANIGLSVIYFKQLYPESHITAFEPDPNIFAVLEQNIRQCGYTDVELANKAVWTEDAALEFSPDGSDGGRIVQLESERQRIQVSTVRLADYLNESVDLLKMDIEGAEIEVLQTCQDGLRNVQYLFVEYHSFVKVKQQLHQLLAILATADFRVCINPITVIRQPFIKRKIFSNMDMQLNIFAFREL